MKTNIPEPYVIAHFCVQLELKCQQYEEFIMFFFILRCNVSKFSLFHFDHLMIEKEIVDKMGRVKNIFCLNDPLDQNTNFSILMKYDRHSSIFEKKVCLVSKLFPFHLSVYNVHSELDFHIPTAKYELIIAFSARYVRIAVFLFLTQTLVPISSHP